MDPLHCLTPDALLMALSAHMGKEHGVPIGQLVYEATAQAPTPALERRARSLISQLREDGHPICAIPSRGYFCARTEEELNECCTFLRDRAMHSLKIEARLRRMALPDLIGQLRFNQ